MESAVIDTNVLIFDTFEDSEFHRDAVTMLDSVDRWRIPSIVYHELIWFFRARRIELAKARLKIEEYLSHEKTSFVPCTPDDLRFAVLKMRKYQEYNDLLILSVARRLGPPLFTFDEGLREMAIRNSIRLGR